MLPEYTLMSGVFIFSVGLTIYPIKAEKRVRYSKMILGSVWLSFLVVGLACNLSCSGAEGAAIMVGILGSAAVVFLLLKAFKMMSKKKTAATT